MNPLRPLALAAAAMALPLSLAAATISGTVIDRTTGKPAAGDTVHLLDLQQGMQESARTTIDKDGHYSFTVPDANGMHLVQVEHQKASYYGSVPPNTSTVNVDVYDVAPQVEGVHVYADVSRLETNQQGLSVTESWFIRNESKPPRTQFGPRAFEFFLPEGSVVEGATATGPGGMAISATPAPLGDKNHYAFLFPVRPGETRFQIGYHIPYSSSLTLQTHVSLPTDNVAIMLPKSMSLSGASFQPLPADANEPGVNTWLSTNVTPAKPVSFTVSGTGSMPREQQGQTAPGGAAGQGMGAQGMGAAPDQSSPAAEPSAAQQAAESNRPGGGLANPNGTPDPLDKYKGWILSGLGLALVVAAAFLLRARPGQQSAQPGPAPAPISPASALTPTPAAARHTPTPAALASNGTTHRPALLAALKEEMFALETDRLEGKLSEKDYSELKSAYEAVLRRALAREAVSAR
jgi:5-hydroxyisourate hydrolase-like protein (transthyretin family)